MKSFHALRVGNIRVETDDTVSVAIDIPDHLKKVFTYKQGQYLTFQKKINGEVVRRSYSLCSSPVADNEWRIAVKKVDQGVFSAYVNHELKEGDILEVMPPEGNFYSEVREGQKKAYCLIAAGSGITPVISIAKTVLSVEKESTIVLYYGNRSKSSVIFRSELGSLIAEHGGRFSVKYIYSREHDNAVLSGRINAALCDRIEKESPDFYSADEYFLCGPEEMIFGLKDKFASKGIPKEKIHFELFTTPVLQLPGENGEMPDIESDVTIIIDGAEFNYRLSSKGPSVLDASMDAGADVPFSCKGAVCCTCRAKLLEGKVKMAMNFALTDREVEEGYILTCQSHPITGKVVIDYDAS